MGCDIISRGSLCSEERASPLYLLVKQFIRWGRSHRALSGPPRARVELPPWVPALREPARPGGSRGSVPPGGAAEGLPPPCSPRTVLGMLCVYTRVSLPLGGARGPGCLQLRPPHRSGMRSARPWVAGASKAAAGANASLGMC